MRLLFADRHMSKPHVKTTEPTFESALERLEQIVEEMEGDRLALEDLLSRYEEGTRLVKVCQHRLDAAEKRIELITRDASGEVRLVAIEATSAGGSGGGAAGAGVSKAGAEAAGGAAAPKSVASRKAMPDDVSLF
ncbi:MAG: Exodeoxyribonuclease 7 small subunit [Verrucomicrobiota bacterium]